MKIPVPSGLSFSSERQMEIEMNILMYGILDIDDVEEEKLKRGGG